MLRLTISTFEKSCEDAIHFYGTVRNMETGKVVYEVKRQFSPEEVIAKANKKFPRSRIQVEDKIEAV